MIRLVRKPSLLVGFIGRLLFVVICAAAVVAAWYFVLKRGTYLIFALVDLLAIAAVWELIAFYRRFRHGAPVVEIDRQSLAYGDSAQVHIVEPHSQSITEMGVKLVGECYAESVTDISSYREKKVALTRCYEEELTRLKNQTFLLQLPKSPPADGINWKIVVAAHLKQGGVIEHSYPLRVRET